MSDDPVKRATLEHDHTLLSDLPSAGARTPTVVALDDDDIPVRATVSFTDSAPLLGDERIALGVTLPSADALRKPGPGEVHAGQILAGKYELGRVIGAGGMGKVWKGMHLGLGVPIAVKIMHPEIAASKDYARRFRREAHAASILNHPNAVRVFDFGDDEGTLYMVMEFLAGESVTAWLGSQDGPPPLVEVAEVMSMLLDAFQVAHGYGIVHRDLKPDNVFLTEVGGKRVVKVVDFGLAHVEDTRDQGPTLTAKDVIAGTPEYMSPEQCRSLAVGPSADIYSMGCLLTEMLQLRPPFTGSSAIEVLAKQMFTPPPPLLRPEGAEPVPPLLERLRLDLLAKSAEKRPRNAAEVKNRLIEAMSSEATLARLPTRKGDEPLGDRTARAVAWDPGEPAPATTRTRARGVALMRLAPQGGGITPECETGLQSQKLEIVVVRGVAEIAAKGLAVVVVDAGTGFDAARAFLAELRQAMPLCRAVVCAADLTTEHMNELVAAGASDVARYPITPDTLGRKLERVIRRGR